MDSRCVRAHLHYFSTPSTLAQSCPSVRRFRTQLQRQESVEELFGDATRQRLLRTLLRSLLDMQAVYVLTANISVQRIANVLNELLEGGDEPSGQQAEVKGEAAAEQKLGGFFHPPPLLQQLFLPTLGENDNGSSSATPASSSSAPAAEIQPPPRWFTVDDTVRYIPVGGKVKAIQRIVAARGFHLVTVFR